MVYIVAAGQILQIGLSSQPQRGFLQPEKELNLPLLESNFLTEERRSSSLMAQRRRWGLGGLGTRDAGSAFGTNRTAQEGLLTGNL